MAGGGYIQYPFQSVAGVAGIASINGDTTSNQFIVGGTGISIITVSGTTTITNTESATNSFVIMQPPHGTAPTASSPTDTLTFTSSDNSVTITGNSGTKTLNFQAASALVFADSLVNSSGTVTLVNDTATPGASKYYGTNAASVLGYYSLPSPGTGTVTSVALAAPSIFTVSGSPVTTSGTLTLSYSGTPLPIANGGTGQTSASAAFGALSPLTTNGDLLYYNSSNTRLPIGTSGQVLTVSGGLPSWQNAPATGVTSVAQTTNSVSGLTVTGSPITTSGTLALTLAQATTSTNGYLSSTDWNTFNSKGSGSVTSVAMTVPAFLSVSGSPITSSGTLAVTLSGTALPVANGGTSLTTLTANAVILGNGTSAPTFVAPGTSGNILKSNGTTWTSVAGTTGTVTSVALSDGSTTPIYTISGSPVTSSGTLTFTLGTQAANKVFAGPTTGAAAQPTFRTLVAADIPSLSYVNTLAAVGSSPNANAGTISTNTLTLQPANGTNPGVVTAIAQTIGGVKTFSANPIVSGAAGAATTQYVNTATGTTSTDGTYVGITSTGVTSIFNHEVGKSIILSTATGGNTALTIQDNVNIDLASNLIVGTTPSVFANICNLDVSQNIYLTTGGPNIGVSFVVLPQVDTDTDGNGTYYGMAIQPYTSGGSNGLNTMAGAIFAVTNSNSGSNGNLIGLQLQASYTGGGTCDNLLAAYFNCDGGNATTNIVSGQFDEPQNYDDASGQYGTAIYANGTLSLASNDNTTAGVINQLPVPTSFIYLTAATTINGIDAPFDGKYIMVYNATGAGITVNNNSGSATAGHKILTPSGAAYTLTNKHTARFIYHGTPGSGNWLLLLD